MIALCAASLAAVVEVNGQVQPPPVLEFGGSVMSRSTLMPADLATLSQTHAFGTARAMGMGGAFVSLGADMTSMSLNPAGLGIYRRNEISLTPMVPLSHASTAGTYEWQGNNRTRFAFANIGAALNVFESPTGALTSLTIGFGMNRIADFNTRYSYSAESVYNPSDDRVMPTIADIFGQQLGQGYRDSDNGHYYSIFPEPQPDGNPNGALGYKGFDPGFWPAILGYNGYMINVEGTGDNRQWVPSFIGHNASVTHSLDMVGSGSINEFTLSAGGNFNNIVYVGASLGIQSVHKKVGMTYQEEYRYYDTDGIAVDKGGYELLSQLNYSSLYQQTVIDGSGVNFKLGVIVRPVAGLRLGVAFHTPTFYSLDFSYRADIETGGRNNETGEKQVSYDGTPTQIDEGSNSWEFTSPARLMFGASYTFGNFAIVSIDYERDWYNGIRVKNLPYGLGYTEGFYKANFKRNFCATNSLRAGIEVRPLPLLALRLGGGYTGSMMRERERFINDPVTYKTYYVSAGAGVNLGRNTTLDVAYQYVAQKQTAYELFFSQDADTGEAMTYSGLYDTSLTRHYIALTLGFRF